MNTKIIRLDVNRPSIEQIKLAAELIDNGGLVAFPTETVYGIACRANSESISRLNEVKGRCAQKHYTLHIGQKGDLGKFVPNISAVGRQLIKKAWPGPLTIIFELSPDDLTAQRAALDPDVFDSIYTDNTLGVRCPDNVIASLLLTHAKYPVVAPSANYAGQPPATTGSDAAAALDGKVDMIIDGGQCKYNKSSTVVKFTSHGIEMLRQGIYDRRDIQAMSQINILFVCTGNTCRSPMAQGLCRKYLAQKLGSSVDQIEKMGYKISSAGVMAAAGWHASPEAIEVCAAKGVDISSHRSVPLSARLIEQSDIIIAMCEHHRRSILDISPDAAEKCILLDQRDIPDPIGGSEKDYYYCAELIEKALLKRISELVK